MSVIQIGSRRFLRPEARRHPDYWRVLVAYVEERLAQGLSAWDDALPETPLPVNHVANRSAPGADDSNEWETMHDESIDLPGPNGLSRIDEERLRRYRRAQDVLTRRNARVELARLDAILEQSRLGELGDDTRGEEASIGLNTAMHEPPG